VEVGTNTKSRGKGQGEKQDGGVTLKSIPGYLPIAFFTASRFIQSDTGVRLSACASVETHVGTYGGGD